jgi:hypothetical protein
MSLQLLPHPLLIDAHPAYLDGWRWLVGNDAVLVAASVSGDLFFRDRDGRVHWIDTGAGSIETVADDAASFARKVRSAEFCSNYLLESLVNDCLRMHGPQTADRCLGYRTLPVFDGAYADDNRVPMRAMEHFAFTGDVHQQIEGLPDGATVELNVK